MQSSPHTSTRKVAFELHGMRPLTVMSPCSSTSISSGADTRGLRDRAARRTTGRADDHRRRARGRGRRTRRPAPRDSRNRAWAASVAASCSSSDSSSSATRTMRSLVSSHATAEGAHDPFGDDGLDEVEQRGHRASLDGRQVREQPGEVVGQRADLLLLALERDDDAVALGLQVEHALPGRTDRARGEHHRVGEIERARRSTHDGCAPPIVVARCVARLHRSLGSL